MFPSRAPSLGMPQLTRREIAACAEEGERETSRFPLRPFLAHCRGSPVSVAELEAVEISLEAPTAAF